MTATPTDNLAFQNFFQATLTSDITASDVDIFLDNVPNGTEGFLVIEPDSTTNREVIFFQAKTATKVTCPSAADGRGQGDTTAVSHTTGATVIMAPVAEYFEYMKTLFTTTPQGWTSLATSVTSVTPSGQKQYVLDVNTDLTSTVSPGHRLKITRTVAAPTQCTSLNGTTQYWVKTSPNKLTFTDDFVVSAWVKLSSYPSGSIIVSRYNGTSGWSLIVGGNGEISLRGFNGGAGNYSRVDSYQSIPLNKWVHVTAQLDMSAFTATSTTSYIMLDGVDIPCAVTRAGTNPTALVQAGNLEIGSQNGGTSPFPGKIAQVAIFNAKVTQATIRGYISQGLSGSETSLASAYSFNGVATDLNTTTPNDLSVGGGSATATNADSPFGIQANGTISSTTEYGIVHAISNTQITVQTPEGGAIPTTGGISALAYSAQRAPYGFPGTPDRWRITSLLKQGGSTTSNANYGSYLSGGFALTVPLGNWIAGWQAGRIVNSSTTAVWFNISKSTSIVGLNETAGHNVSPYSVGAQSSAAAQYSTAAQIRNNESLSTVATFVMYTMGSTTSASISSASGAEIFAENGYL